MKVVLFGGTTEGRTLSGVLAALGAQVTVCVATDYGRQEQGTCAGVVVRAGRLEAAEMEEVLRGAALCVDATHPYAMRAGENIAAACANSGVPRLRLLRRESPLPAGAAVFSSAQEAVAHLGQTEGNVFLTTGAKELPAFAGVDVQRLYVRVLPLRESLEACAAAGIPGSHIVAMQGPFSQALNEALLRQFAIRFLVTKNGGAAGGFSEKAAAANAVGAQMIVLRRPREDGADYEAVLRRCREVLGCR